NTHQIVFSTPVRRRDYLFGRFFGALAVSFLPLLGVSLGILLAKHMPGTAPDRWEAVNWTAHLYSILGFALPNTFLMASIIFAVAVWSRRDAVSFIAAVLLFVGFLMGDVVFQAVKFEQVAALLDPFGIRTLAFVTKYWTAAEKNSRAAGIGG